MPRVPLSTGPQLTTQAQPGGFIPQVDTGATGRAVSQALDRVSDNVDKIAQRDDEIATSQVDAKLAGDWMAKDAELRTKYQGANVDQYQAEAAKWWQDAPATYGQALSSRGKTMLGQVLGRRQSVALGTVAQHVNNEKERTADDAAAANINTTIQFGVTSGDVAGAAARVRQLTADVGARKGWNTDQVMAEQGKHLSALHLAQIGKLVERDAPAAQAYYDANKAEVGYAQQPRVEEMLRGAVAANDGDKAASEVWASMGPKGYNDPVQIDKLEAQIRERFPNDAPRRQAAIAAVRERAAAHNAAQAETNAGNTNAVYAQLDAGKPMAQVMRSVQWLALPATEQHKIMLQRENEAAARDSRAAAADQREYMREQRKERALLLNNGDAYLRYSDPEVLARMTRPQVEATRAVFGFEGAQHLLTKYDSLQKAGAVAEAKIDKEDFNHIAEQMGLDPYSASWKRGHAKELGELQFRVEQLINIAQQAKKQPLTRDEKMALMQGELARQVTVDNGLFMPNERKPIIQLTTEEAYRVVVPAAERAKIIDAMKAMYAQDPKNPDYAPTEDNLRRIYLARQSKATGLIAPSLPKR